jgi:putative Ca2+/H+ antiporter (TMEM165/GDT1 family)
VADQTFDQLLSLHGMSLVEGDKSQLMAMTFAARYRARDVLIGVNGQFVVPAGGQVEVPTLR